MVEESHICRVLEMVWDATLHLPVQSWNPSVAPPYLRTLLAGFVQVTGGWEGTVGVHVPLAMARQAAAIMFKIPVNHVTDADVCDAFGELANQIGGNLKPLLPGECRISLPTVLAGNDFLARTPCAELLLEVIAQTEGRAVMVTVVETLPTREEVQGRFRETHTAALSIASAILTPRPPADPLS